MKALGISNFFKKNPQRPEETLISIFKNQKLKIKEIKTLKEKLIINKDYKITCLATLKDNHPQRIILEIHDNKDYFQRNLFALKNFITEDLTPAKIYGIDKNKKIIYREYLEGNFVYNLILKGKLSKKEIYKFVKKATKFLHFLHHFKFKEIPNFLSKRLNQKIERIFLSRALEFVRPNFQSFKPILERNLKVLLRKMNYLEKINKKCLIHGDYQPGNFILSLKKGLRLMDFDTVEMGNPARDLGRFLAQMSLSLKSLGWGEKKVSKIENLFLAYYLKSNKRKFYPNFETNLNTYKAEMLQYEMLQYIIFGKMGRNKMPFPKEIEQLLNYQTSLLNL